MEIYTIEDSTMKKKKSKKSAILESNVFNMTNQGLQTAPVIDTSISISGYTKYKNQLISGVRDMMRFKPDIYLPPSRKIPLELSEFKVKHLFPDDNNLDIIVYFQFKSQDYLHEGHIRNYCNENGKVQLKSTFFDMHPYYISNIEVNERLYNYVTKNLDNFFIPAFGVYEYDRNGSEKDIGLIDPVYGQMITPKNKETLEVKDVDIISKQIRVTYENKEYIVQRNNYYRFKYCFDKVEYGNV